MIQIRLATDADHPALAEIFLITRQQAFREVNPALFHFSDFERQTEGEIIYLACNEYSLPLGFISIWQQDSFVHHLFIDPKHQRRGIGTLLIKSLHSWLPLPYRLKCLSSNSSARAFYRSLGWDDVGGGSDSLGEYRRMELTEAQ